MSDRTKRQTDGELERIRSLDIDQIRPVEALQLLSELQKELKRP